MTLPRGRPLVVGASGLLGGHLMELQPGALGTYRRRPRPGLSPLDLAHPASVDALLDRTGPVSIAILATNPPSLEWCEREPDASRREMVDEVAAFVDRLRRHSPAATVVHVSTDYVFDGARGDYLESDAPRPLQAYGSHKLAAERAVMASGLRAWVVRTSFLYGESRWDRTEERAPPLSFVAAARGQARLRVAANLWSSPTEVRSLARLLWSLEGTNGDGILHAVGGPRVSRLDVLREVLAVWGLPEWAGLQPLHADQDGRIPGQSLRRPRDSTLASQRTSVLGRSPLPGLREGLEAVRRRLEAG